MNGDTTRKSRQNEPIKKHGHGQPGQLQHLWKEQVLIYTHLPDNLKASIIFSNTIILKNVCVKGLPSHETTVQESLTNTTDVSIAPYTPGPKRFPHFN